MTLDSWNVEVCSWRRRGGEGNGVECRFKVDIGQIQILHILPSMLNKINNLESLKDLKHIM